MSEHDDLDRRLRAAGESWRATHDLPPLEVPVSRRRPGWVVPVAAAAGVALLVGGAVAIASQLDDHRAGGPADTVQEPRWDPDLPPGFLPADVPGAVPPVNQQVAFPAAEVSGAFDPGLTETVGKPACRADDVELGLGRGEGPGVITYRLVAKRAGTACVVSRQPFLQYLRDGKYVEVLTRTPDPQPGDWPADVLLTPASPAVLRTTWAGWCEEPPFDTVEMVFDDNSQAHLTIAGRVTGCDEGAAADLPQRMLMSGWQPESWSVGRPDDFSGLRARLVETVEGPHGLPTWVVELTAPRDIDLDACPSWEVRQGGEASASWRLNCAGMPDRRSTGTPYLPAGKPVRLAVWVPYGDTDAPLTWVLTTPEGPVTVDLSPGPPAPTGEPRLVQEGAANLHLWLSNQSFDDPEVRVTVAVDGTELVDQELAVDGQHEFLDFHLAVPAGEHEVVVTSDTGARMSRTVRVPERGDRWAAALSWGDDDDQTFDWMFQDHPIAWD